MSRIRPFLKWAGGKYRLLDRSLPERVGARRLVVPVAGSAAVFLNASCPEAWINDASRDIVACWRCLLREGEDFIARAQALFTPENNTPGRYYALRERFNASPDPGERAALLIYLNRHGVTGLRRCNASGAHNVPFGRYRSPVFPGGAMRAFLERARACSCRFTCMDFREVFAGVRPGDAVYCDPPYVPLSATARFTAYNGGAFTVRDQEDLAALARRACEDLGATVVVSNHDTPLTRRLYEGARLVSFDVRRVISCRAEGRGSVRVLFAVFRPGSVTGECQSRRPPVGERRVPWSSFPRRADYL